MTEPQHYTAFNAKMTKITVLVSDMSWWFPEGDEIALVVDRERIGDAPNQDVLEALYWAFYDGRRHGREQGRRSARMEKADG